MVNNSFLANNSHLNINPDLQSLDQSTLNHLLNLRVPELNETPNNKSKSCQNAPPPHITNKSGGSNHNISSGGGSNHTSGVINGIINSNIMITSATPINNSTSSCSIASIEKKIYRVPSLSRQGTNNTSVLLPTNSVLPNTNGSQLMSGTSTHLITTAPMRARNLVLSELDDRVSDGSNHVSGNVGGAQFPMFFAQTLIDRADAGQKLCPRGVAAVAPPKVVQQRPNKVPASSPKSMGGRN